MYWINLRSLLHAFLCPDRALGRAAVRVTAHFCIVVLGFTPAFGVQAFNYAGDTRMVAVSATAPAPPALSFSVGATNTPSAPFTDLSLQASGQIDWSSVDDWTAPPTLASAAQTVLFSADQITVSVDLLTHVGGDPYGARYASPYSGAAYATSLFAVGFNVNVPMSYEYSFDFGLNTTLQAADLHLTSLNGLDVQLFSTGGASQEGSVILQPGEDYTLTFNFSCAAIGDKFGGSSSILVFAVEAVPEPQVPALLTLGGILLGWYRCRPGRSRTGC
jgi:hypothetical protein